MTAMQLAGSLCALVTPFDDDGAVDLAAFERLLDGHLQAGTHGLVVAGSTGESAMLDEDEFRRLLVHAVRYVDGRVPVLAGTGTAGTAKTVRTTQLAQDCGVDAALVVTPYYVRPTQDGLYRHYLEVAEAGGLPVVLYNVPGRTGCDLLPATVARLASHPAVVGIKEAVADRQRLADLLSLRADGFVVLSGDDETACASILAGADGVISVAANVVPGLFAQLCDHARAGRSEAAQAIDAALTGLYAFLGVEPNPIPVKWLLARQGLCSPRLRLPLTELSESLHGQAESILAALTAASPSLAIRTRP